METEWENIAEPFHDRSYTYSPVFIHRRFELLSIQSGLAQNYVYTAYLHIVYMSLITVQVALVAINTALKEGNADSTLETLLNEHLDLSDVSPENKDYYYTGLKGKKQKKEAVKIDSV